jgi:hypothetical protein
MMAKRDIPHYLEGEGKRLKRGQSEFQRKGDLIVQLIGNHQTQQIYIYKVTYYRVSFIKFNRTTCFGLLRPSPGPKS